jgi:serine/threonine-protein kinase
MGATWGPDDTIVLALGEAAGLLAVPGQGGTPGVLTTPDVAGEEDSHRLPHALPNGRGVLFTITRNVYDSHPRLAALDTRTRRWHVVMEDAADGSYAASGHLVFLREGVLMAAPFDQGALAATGPAVPVISHVEQALNLQNTTNTGAGQFAMSASGLIAYLPGGVSPDYNYALLRVDERGKAEPLDELRGYLFGPRVSPDGSSIAYFTMGSNWRLWIYDIARGTARALTRGGWVNWFTWLDNRSVVLGFGNPGRPNLYRLAVDGGSTMERLTTSRWIQSPSSASPDGKTVVFVELQQEPARDILLVDVQSRLVTPYLATPATEVHPTVSPDGRWLAYASDEAGRMDVYVRSFPRPGGVTVVSAEGGREPLWSPAGDRLFFRRESEVWAAAVLPGAEIAFGRPRRLFHLPGCLTGQSVRNWDVFPDGRSFVMVRGETREARPATEFVLVQNWFEEVKATVPISK